MRMGGLLYCIDSVTKLSLRTYNDEKAPHIVGFRGYKNSRNVINKCQIVINKTT